MPNSIFRCQGVYKIYEKNLQIKKFWDNFVAIFQKPYIIYFKL